MDLVQTVSPDFSDLPVTRDELLLALRIDDQEDATLVDALIQAAVEWCEAYTNRQFVTATWELRIDEFPSGELVLPKPPIQSIESVKYLDSDGVEQTVSSDTYRLLGANSKKNRGRIDLDYQKTWPAHRGDKEKVIIEYKSGYGNAASVPSSIKAAIKLLVGHLWENREATVEGALRVIPYGVEDLLSQERIVPV